MFITRISRYIYFSVLSTVSRNRGRAWNVLSVDTGAHLYTYYLYSTVHSFVAKYTGSSLGKKSTLSLKCHSCHQKSLD
jgi:hypothetical protein